MSNSLKKNRKILNCSTLSDQQSISIVKKLFFAELFCLKKFDTIVDLYKNQDVGKSFFFTFIFINQKIELLKLNKQKFSYQKDFQR